MGWCWWWRGNELDCFKLWNIALVGRWWQRRRATKIQIQTQLGRLEIWWGLTHIWKGHSLNRKLTWILKRKKMKVARRMLSRKQLICRCTTHASDQLDKTAQVVYFTISPFFLYFSVFHFFLQLFSFSPELSDGPSLVYVNVFVRSFSKIDDVKMVKIDLISHVRFWTSCILHCVSDFVKVNIFSVQEYSFQVTLRQQWNDKRLRFEELLKAKGVGEGNITVWGLFRE